MGEQTGCYLDPTLNFTGTIVVSNLPCPFLAFIQLLHVSQSQSRLNCDATINENAGCGVTEWSRASYGPYFESQGGGVIAMKWDEDGIAICTSLRSVIFVTDLFEDRVVLPRCYSRRCYSRGACALDMGSTLSHSWTSQMQHH